MGAKAFPLVQRVEALECGVPNPDAPWEVCDRWPHPEDRCRHWCLVVVDDGTAWSEWYADVDPPRRVIDIPL